MCASPRQAEYMKSHKKSWIFCTLLFYRRGLYTTLQTRIFCTLLLYRRGFSVLFHSTDEDCLRSSALHTGNDFLCSFTQQMRIFCALPLYRWGFSELFLLLCSADEDFLRFSALLTRTFSALLLYKQGFSALFRSTDKDILQARNGIFCSLKCGTKMTPALAKNFLYSKMRKEDPTMFGIGILHSS